MGHFSVVCRAQKFKADRVKQSQQEDQVEAGLLSIQVLPQMVSLMDSRGKKHNLSPNDMVPHMVDTNGELEIAKPESQPRIDIEIQVDIAA